ncbi:uridine kinase [Pseudonocardia spinosispora]|uniref:uridine kinase n=1 Tax=Pseudonocardia spinosispora TaxID=103441 RepID=UPI0003F90585|nr:uridine kinase [Pseudonocardia spinosispora]
MPGSRISAVRWPALADELAERLSRAEGRQRVLIDGPPPTRPEALAQLLAERLRVLGRRTVTVEAADYLRPASVRLEHGHTDPDEFLDSWLDVAGLRREVLNTDGRVLPRLWNAANDRAFRDSRVELPADGIVVVSGALLLGRGLPAELTVHLRMTAAALARRTEESLHWTLPAYVRYDVEHHPTEAHVLVLADDPDRPALARS